MVDAIDKNKTGEIQDSSWVRQSLFLPGRVDGKNTRSDEILRSQQFSIGSLNFADTSLGGNRSINPRAQFTKNCDPLIDSLLVANVSNGKADPNRSMGMGRYYSEAVDTQSNRIYMQFGIPAFNSLTNFFSMFYDREMATLANTGKTSSLFYSIAKYTSYFVLWEVHAVLAVSSFLYKAYRSVAGKPMSKFYYMKPSMPLYWSSVSIIVNALAVNMGLAQGADAGQASNSTNAIPTGFDGGDTIEIMHKLLPYIMKSDTGGIDIRAVANRYQRLANAHGEELRKIAETYTDEQDLEDKVRAYLNQDPSTYLKNTGNNSTRDYLDNYLKSAGARGTGLNEPLIDDDWKPKDKSVMEKNTAADKSAAAAFNSGYADRAANGEFWTGMSEHLSKFWDFTNAERKGGSDFISFIVEEDTQVTESWTNTTKTSDIANTMNQTSSSSRSRIFNMAGGNVGDNVLLNSLEFIGGAVKDMIGGALDGFGLSGLAAMGGSAFVDMPEFWEDSVTSLPNTTYTIQLRTPYGNSVSIFNNILIPLSMLLASVTPRSTGVNSYTSPYLCKLWHPGVNKIELGMVTALNVTRGVGTMGWNVKNQVTAIDISFTITNLSKMLHMPITNEVGLKDALRLTMFDEPNNFTDYMGTLAGLSINDEYYLSNKARLNMARSAENFDSWLSTGNIVGNALETFPGGLLKLISGKATI